MVASIESGWLGTGPKVMICQGVTLGIRYLNRQFEAPKLGDRVNVGAGAKILGNVTIGHDANIGANAVVLSDLPPGKTAVGIPAKIIKFKDAENNVGFRNTESVEVPYSFKPSV